MRIGLLCLSILIAAGTYAQEAQVPLDSAGAVQVMDAETARQLDLFGNYPGFREARLFQISERAYVLEISYQPQQQLLKAREDLTTAQVDSLREDITRRMRARPPAQASDQSGRVKLLVGTTFLGLTYYGISIPVMLDVNDTRPAVGLYMLTAGSSFLIPYLISRHTPINSAEAGAAFYGGTLGILHGIELYGLLAGNDASGNGALFTGLMGSVGEMIGGYQWAHRANLSRGTVTGMAACGDFGIIFGGTAGLLLREPAERNRRVLPGGDDNDADIDAEIRTSSAAILAGSVAGIAVGRWLTAEQEYGPGDGYVLYETGFLALGAAASMVDLADANPTITELAMMVASAGGIAAGHVLTRPVSFTGSQGTLIGLSELGGALFGTGVAYLVTKEDDSAPYMTMATVGGAAGFYLSYRAFSRWGNSREHSFLNIQIAPAGVMAYGRDRIHVVPGATLKRGF